MKRGGGDFQQKHNTHVHSIYTTMYSIQLYTLYNCTVYNSIHYKTLQYYIYNSTVHRTDGSILIIVVQVRGFDV